MWWDECFAHTFRNTLPVFSVKSGRQLRALLDLSLTWWVYINLFLHQRELTGSIVFWTARTAPSSTSFLPNFYTLQIGPSTWPRSPIRRIWTPVQTRRAVIQPMNAYDFWTTCSMIMTLPPRARSPVHGSNSNLSGSCGSTANTEKTPNLIQNRPGGRALSATALSRSRLAAALRHHFRPRIQSGRWRKWRRPGCPGSGSEEPSRMTGGLAAAWLHGRCVAGPHGGDLKMKPVAQLPVQSSNGAAALQQDFVNTHWCMLKHVDTFIGTCWCIC